MSAPFPSLRTNDRPTATVPANPRPALVRQSPSRAGLAFKRGVDLVAGSLALIVAVPLMVVVAIAILLVDGRPIFFVQERVGLDGARFRLIKFRTMVRDAEEHFGEVAALSDTRGAGFKMRGDPRVTRLGHWLRRSSLDELPQIWNVLHGEMSLVGPRPAPPREVDRYNDWQRGRLSMKPGMTGMWQVASRFDEDFDRRASLDLIYIQHWSPWLDLVILVRTVPAVLLLTGR